MQLLSAAPVTALLPYVRCFEQREALIAGDEVIYPIAARHEQFLEFYLKERYLVHSYASGTREPAPRAVVVGLCTHRRVALALCGQLQVFTVHFQPSGFCQLFGVPMPEFTDHAYEARSVLGTRISEIEERLADAAGFAQRIDVATAFLLKRAIKVHAPDAVAKIANRILLERGALHIPEAAASTGLSIRQFERRFREQVGVAPRLYARIVRFQGALSSRLMVQRRTWTEIAQEFGYYDQMHMVHDFRRFSGESPTGFFEHFMAMPERWS